MRVDRSDVGLNVNRAEVVDRAFLDLKRDDEALLGGIVLGGRRNDLHVGKAVLEVESPDQVAIGLDSIGVVNVRGLEKTEKIRFSGLDDLFQAPGRIAFIADEDDRLDAGLLAFLDREDQIDAIVRTLDNLGHHGNVEATAALIDLDDALGVGLHLGSRQRVALARLNLFLELFVLQTAIAFEGQPIDDGRFHDGHDDASARAGNVHVLEKSGTVERLQAGVDCSIVERLAGPNLEIGANRIGLDPTIAFDDDGVRGRARASRRRGQRTSSGKANVPHSEEQAGHDQPSSHPPTHVHAQRALIPLAAAPDGGLADFSLVLSFVWRWQY